MRIACAPADWLVLDEVDSTQSEVNRRLKADASTCPPVVLARTQLAGRGRFDRAWFGAPGDSLAMSVVLREYTEHPKPWFLGMAMACAVASAIHCLVRWPNDLVLDGKKVGGILSELVADGQGRRVPVIGVGLNLGITDFPAEIAETATSLSIHRPGTYRAEDIAQSILDRYAGLPEVRDWPDLRPIWSLFDATAGKKYRLSDGALATGIGVGPEGELVCAVDGETQLVHAADAIFGSPVQVV